MYNSIGDYLSYIAAASAAIVVGEIAAIGTLHYKIAKLKRTAGIDEKLLEDLDRRFSNEHQ